MPLMLGGEIDLQGAGMKGTQNTNGPFAVTGFPGFTCSPCNYTASQSLDWFSTARVRVGMPFDNFLVYGTGGVIVGGVTTSQSLNFSGTPGYVSNSKSALAGPTVGGGVEVLLPGPLSAKLEGLYYDLGTVRTTTLPQNGFGANFSEQRAFGLQGVMIRLGINFRLGDFGAF
jgi:outer membrane immunogenic protein